MRYRKNLNADINCGGNKVLSGMSCKSVSVCQRTMSPGCRSSQRRADFLLGSQRLSRGGVSPLVSGWNHL